MGNKKKAATSLLVPWLEEVCEKGPRLVNVAVLAASVQCPSFHKTLSAAARSQSALPVDNNCELYHVCSVERIKVSGLISCYARAVGLRLGCQHMNDQDGSFDSQLPWANNMTYLHVNLSSQECIVSLLAGKYHIIFFLLNYNFAKESRWNYLYRCKNKYILLLKCLPHFLATRRTNSPKGTWWRASYPRMYE